MTALGDDGPARYFHCLWNPGCRFKRRINRWSVPDEQVAEDIALEDALKIADQYSVNLMRSRFNRHFNERHSNETMPDWLKLPRKVAAKSPEGKTAKKAVKRNEAKLAVQPAAALANKSAKHGRGGGAVINAALYGGGAGVRIRDPIVSAGGSATKKRKAEAAPQPEPFAASTQASIPAGASGNGCAAADKRSTSDPAPGLPQQEWKAEAEMALTPFIHEDVQGLEQDPVAGEAAAPLRPPPPMGLASSTSTFPTGLGAEKRRRLTPVAAAVSAAIGAAWYIFGLPAGDS